MTPEDSELLRQFARDGSQSAFAELVGRHLDLVYSVALRRLNGDAHSAQDIAQEVFTDLARKAGSLSHHPTLTGWLYTSTRFAADEAARSEKRRGVREATAFTMSTLNSEPATDTQWAKLRPVLDDAIAELDEENRIAVLLRYFENRPFAEIARTLRINEDGARKRVSRSLDRLSESLLRRGVSSTAAALAPVLTAHGTVGTPAALTIQIASTSIVQAGTVSATSSKAAALVILVLALIGFTGVTLQFVNVSQLTDQVAALRMAESTPRRVTAAPTPMELVAPVVAPSPEASAFPPARVIPVVVQPPPSEERKPFTMEFPNTDAKVIVSSIADLFGFKVEIPEGLQGKVSVKLKNVPWDRAFRNALTPLGYTFVEDNKVIRIVPFPDEATRMLAALQIAAENQADQLDDPPTPPWVPRGPRVPVLQPLPQYPASLLESKPTGIVSVQYSVSPNGDVTDVFAVARVRPEFEEAALNAVRNWKYNPDGSGGTLMTGVQIEFSPDSPTAEITRTAGATHGRDSSWF